jgi:Mor family transcriptional regulator
MITNYDLFVLFLDDCKGMSEAEVIKNWGGSSIYVPSYKNTHRNGEIIKRYKEAQDKVGVIREIAKEFNIGAAQVYTITKEVRDENK